MKAKPAGKKEPGSTVAYFQSYRPIERLTGAALHFRVECIEHNGRDLIIIRQRRIESWGYTESLDNEAIAQGTTVIRSFVTMQLYSGHTCRRRYLVHCLWGVCVYKYTNGRDLA